MPGGREVGGGGGEAGGLNTSMWPQNIIINHTRDNTKRQPVVNWLHDEEILRSVRKGAWQGANCDLKRSEVISSIASNYIGSFVTKDCQHMSMVTDQRPDRLTTSI